MDKMKISHRIIFGLIAVMLTFSFFFFGVQQVTPSQEGTRRSPKDQEITILSQFLNTDRYDDPLISPNRLNPGIIRREMLEQGGGFFFEMLSEDVRSKCRSHIAELHHRSPFQHAHFPLLGLVNFIKQNDLETAQLLESIQEGQVEGYRPSFEALAALYTAHMAHSPQAIRTALLHQEKQLSQWIPLDPALPRADLSLLGHHGVSGIFSEDFLRL
ncbi:MAG: hypothetical protein VXZ72_03570, partial [Chlamydiota bacterium]|nr:hypothetical protein [Chlamydiota bacterium]